MRTTKRCPDCGKVKPLTEFGPSANGKFGRHTYCRPCQAIRQREWRQRHPDRVRAENKRRLAEKREHANNARAACAVCGGPMGAGTGYPGRSVERCSTCRHEQARERTSRWLELRRQGLANYEIAHLEGVAVYVVANALQRSRVARFPELTWLPAPYAAARGVAA